ncbi:hypothetical protein ACS0TY_027075 [Phlomoides rotata]
MAKISTKFHLLILILLLFLIIFPVPSKGRLVLLHYNISQKETSSSSETNHRTATRPHRVATGNTTSDRQFRSAAHEVPSGPNPESN